MDYLSLYSTALRHHPESQNGKLHTEETKAKIKEANLGKPKSPAHRLKLAAANLGKPGHSHTPETKAKLREARKYLTIEAREKMASAQRGRVISTEQRAKQSQAFTLDRRKELTQANRARVWTDEMRAKVGAAGKKRIPWNKGVPRTEEERAKMSDSHKGQIPWNKGKKLQRAACLGESEPGTGEAERP